MIITTYMQASDFLARAGAELERNEVLNGLPLGIALHLQKFPERIEILPYLATVEDEAASWARTRIGNGEVYLWVLPDGPIVSLVATTRPLSRVISIAYVYTPPELRGHGYASRSVAALSQHLLDSGWQRCSLFTNLSNPTSNNIYQQVGYRPVHDFNEYDFSDS